MAAHSAAAGWVVSRGFGFRHFGKEQQASLTTPLSVAAWTKATPKHGLLVNPLVLVSGGDHYSQTSSLARLAWPELCVVCSKRDLSQWFGPSPVIDWWFDFPSCEAWSEKQCMNE